MLISVFEICDEHSVQLLALWIPREENIISDYLSHFCVIINRDEFEGNGVRDLSVFDSHRETRRGNEEHEGDEKGKSRVSQLVYKPGVRVRVMSVRSRSKEQRLD